MLLIKYNIAIRHQGKISDHGKYEQVLKNVTRETFAPSFIKNVADSV